MVVKSENLNVDPSGLPMEEENESYYDEGVDEYDNSAYLDESGDFSADSKGKFSKIFTLLERSRLV